MSFEIAVMTLKASQNMLSISQRHFGLALNHG